MTRACGIGSLLCCFCMVASIGSAQQSEGREALERGITERTEGDLPAAESSLRIALADPEVEAFARLELATTLAFAKRFAESRALYESALVADPTSRGALHGLAMVSLWEGRAEEARDRYRELVALDGDDASAHRGLGAAELELMNVEAARAPLERAIELGDDSAISLLRALPYAYRTELAVTGGVVVQDGASPRGEVRFSRAMTPRLNLGASFRSMVPRRDLGQAAHEGGVSLTIARAVTVGYQIGLGDGSVRHALVLAATHAFGPLVLMGMASPRVYHDGRFGLFFMAGVQLVARRFSVLGQLFRLDEQGASSATTGALSLLSSPSRRLSFRLGASVTKTHEDSRPILLGANASIEGLVLPRFALVASYSILFDVDDTNNAEPRHDVSLGFKWRFAR